MHILVSGATGFIGRPLCGELLRSGHTVTAVSRDPERARRLLSGHVTTVDWSEPSLRDACAAADAVVNLAGESIGGRRWSAAVKEKLRASRIDATRKLVDAIEKAGGSVRTLVNASAVGYYGDQGSREVTEETQPAGGFLCDLAVAWEAEARRAESAGARVVLARFGVALAEDGGAMEKLLPPFKMGVGGPLGNGRQWFPWVHRSDAVRMVAWLLARPEAHGPFNVTASEPVTNAGFARALGRALGRPALLPVPALALRLLLGEFADSLLSSQKAIPRAAERLGFEWTYPTIERALANIVGKEGDRDE
jgi:uncharacterized protein